MMGQQDGRNLDDFVALLWERENNFHLLEALINQGFSYIIIYKPRYQIVYAFEKNFKSKYN